MSDEQDRVPTDLQRELDQEQAVADLDQGIADREQARVDRVQEPLDAAQEALSREAPRGSGGGDSHAQRTAELGLQQDRQDAHQAQIDQTQLAQGVRQDVIDQQQADLEEPSGVAAGDRETALAQAGEELQQALRERAKQTLARAEGTRERAAEALLRLEAAESRQRERL
jgi:hypothetical protein